MPIVARVVSYSARSIQKSITIHPNKNGTLERSISFITTFLKPDR